MTDQSQSNEEAEQQGEEDSATRPGAKAPAAGEEDVRVEARDSVSELKGSLQRRPTLQRHASALAAAMERRRDHPWLHSHTVCTFHQRHC